MSQTYVHDLVRKLLGLPLLLLEVRGIAVKLSGVHLLVETSLDTEELLVRSELIPRTAGRAGAKCKFVNVARIRCPTRSRGRRARICGRIRLPGLQLPFTAWIGLLGDVRIRLEGCAS